MVITALFMIVKWLETTQIYIHRRMDKQSVVYPFNGVFLSNKANIA